jgi:SPP1 gp7 family putative phage head morphogenesis protein
MAIGMEPKEAVEFFEKKGWEITWSWKEVMDDANNKVFQVAKSLNMEILQTIRNEVDQAIKDGVSFENFRENLEPKLQAQGWWGKKEIVGPRGVEEVQLGSPHRLETIYRTNVQSSYNAGRWQGQVENKRRRPYLMLVEVIDKSTRDSHREMSGSIAPVDSPFWQGPNSWYPPNGWRCRGRVRALTEAQAMARGIGIKGNRLPDEGFGGNPGITKWEPEKDDFDQDIWALGEGLE